jgi:hypothetical protein
MQRGVSQAPNSKSLSETVRIQPPDISKLIGSPYRDFGEEERKLAMSNLQSIIRKNQMVRGAAHDEG